MSSNSASPSSISTTTTTLSYTQNNAILLNNCSSPDSISNNTIYCNTTTNQTNMNQNTSKSSVTSIVRDSNFLANREIIAASVGATTNTASSNNHFYQNVQQVKNLLTSQASNNHQDHHHGGGGLSSLKFNMQPQTQTNQQPNTPPPPPPPHSTQPTNVLQNSAVINKLNQVISNGTAPATNGNVNGMNSKVRNLDGYVGFANLPNQVYRKSVKKGFEFNLMIIGESGLGKSTFINSLFLTELYNPQDFPGTFERSRKKTTHIDSTAVMLTEKGVNLKLTVIDTPGYGDCINNNDCWKPIIEYIDSKYEEYLNAESKVNRKLPISDQRVHCCLHFIAPGHT